MLGYVIAHDFPAEHRGVITWWLYLFIIVVRVRAVQRRRRRWRRRQRQWKGGGGLGSWSRPVVPDARSKQGCDLLLDSVSRFTPRKTLKLHCRDIKNSPNCLRRKTIACGLWRNFGASGTSLTSTWNRGVFGTKGHMIIVFGCGF